MKELLDTLNRTPGVLGSAFVRGEMAVCDIGDALGGSEALPLARRAAEACRAWQDQRPEKALESVVCVGARGRIVVWPVAGGALMAFAENDASAGILRLRMKEAAQKIAETAPADAPEPSNHQATAGTL